MSTTHSWPPHRHRGRRQIDFASLALLACGLVAGVVAYRLITDRGLNPLILVPAVVAVTLALPHLTKRQAPRDRS